MLPGNSQNQTRLHCCFPELVELTTLPDPVLGAAMPMHHSGFPD